MHLSRTSFGLSLCSVAIFLLLGSGSRVHAVDVVWDGGGADSLWSNPTNWVGDVVPASTDRAVFNGTSGANAVAVGSIELDGLVLEAGYTGIVSIAEDLSMSLFDQLTVSGGTLMVGDNANVGPLQADGGTISVVGSLQASGAVTLGGVDLTAGSLHCLNGDLNVTAGTVTLANLHTHDPTTLSGGVLELENWFVHDPATIDGGVVQGDELAIILHDATPFDAGPTVLAVRAFRVIGFSGLQTFFGSVQVSETFECYSEVDWNGNVTLAAGADFLVSAIGTLNLQAGGTIAAQLAATFVNEGTIVENGLILSPGSIDALTGPGGATTLITPLGDPVYIQLTDLDENLLGAVAEGAVVTVEAVFSGDCETVVLTESTASSGIFVNTVGLPSVLDPIAIPEDGQLQVPVNDALRIRYTDPSDPTDSVTRQIGIFLLDCNGNGQPDSHDIAMGVASDCNGNGTPDSCELTTFSDMNMNGILDVCEVTEYRRGDCNGDGSHDIGDAVTILQALFGSGMPLCQDACDGNGDGLFNIADGIYMLAFSFSMGTPPPPPFPACGSTDTLGCDSYTACP